MIRFFYVVLIAVIVQVGCSDSSEKSQPATTRNESTILYTWNFEGATPLHDLGELTTNVSVVSDPLDTANKVMKSTLPNGVYRAEVSVESTSGIHYFYANSSSVSNGDEFWVGGRILKYKEAYTTGVNTTPSIFQIGPIQNIIDYPGVSSNGHYQLQLEINSDSWRWREFTSVYYNPGNYAGVISSVAYGVWEKFVLHCKFRSDASGLIEVWKNGVLVFRKEAANSTSGNCRTRIKWGLYVGTTAGNEVHDPLSCYYDDIRIGNRNASYGDVVP